jgi:putative transposase
VDAQQLREAFPWNDATRYLVHDRDTAFHAWATTAPAMGIDDAYAERLIGSIRRECLDHVIVGNAHGLRRVLVSYIEYSLKSRTHLSLDKDAPISRQLASPAGAIVAIPHLGGLHHHYERRAAQHTPLTHLPCTSPAQTYGESSYRHVRSRSLNLFNVTAPSGAHR